ncbi:MAG TPA: phosphoribosylanthranilate isomerase [Stellaceae bacterium]|nr:phosphoribosylanthranilate isomerase [Stellaceae bacterium]
MSVDAKICGLSTAEGVAAAARHGARFVGFVFYPPSRRNVTPSLVAALAALVPEGITKVGLFVDADDATLSETLARAPLDMLQFHGRESPERVAWAKRRFGKPVMKSIPVAAESDLAQAGHYFGVADRLIFDAKPPKDATVPGGNGLVFDWELLGGKRWPVPWMLSGGLSAENLGDAVRLTHAGTVDVSSGVERAPGIKDPEKIAAFLARTRQL